ncbi:transposase [Streptomyces sp. SBR177]
MLTRCEEITKEICADFAAGLKQFNGEGDHVHLLVHYPRRSSSPCWSTPSREFPPGCSKECDSHVRPYHWGGHFWSGSCFARSYDGAAPLTGVKQYIEQQKRSEHHESPQRTPPLRRSRPRKRSTLALKGGTLGKISGS